MSHTPSNTVERLVVSLAMTSFIFIAIYFSTFDYVRPFFTLLAASVIGVALWEFYHIAKGKGFKPLSGLGIVGSIAYLYSVQLVVEYPAFFLLPYFILFLIMALGFLSYFFVGERPLSNLATTFFGLVYLTVPLGLLITINFDFGRSYLVYLILITKLTDTGAYFFGKKFGRVKLAPYISPNKTWEGAVGGFVVGITASLILSPLVGFSFNTGLFLGTLLSLASIFGDLTESLLKRDLGVNNSSHLPGLGGFLDIVDSMVFTTPLMFFYLKWMGTSL